MNTTIPFLALLVLPWFTGCATSHLAGKIRRNHRYIHSVRQDPDRVTEVLESARDSNGNVYIRYLGAHGPDYTPSEFVLHVPARRIAAARRQSKEFSRYYADFDSAALPLPRRRTRETSGLPSRADKPLPHVFYDQTKGSYPEFLREVGAGPLVIHRRHAADQSLYGFVLTRKVNEPSLNIALLFPPENENEPFVHLNLCTPWRTEHDFSGLYWRMLYPVTITWDIVTIPVQAVVLVWAIATLPQGGWLF